MAIKLELLKELVIQATVMVVDAMETASVATVGVMDRVIVEMVTVSVRKENKQI